MFKRICSTLFTLMICLSAFAQNKIEKASVKISMYCDHCLECESCGNRLENAVLKLKGIKEVKVIEESKSVEVTYNSKRTELEDIREAIAAVGFDADDIKANPEAYKLLDACCQK